jgi:hypothetical protein
MPKMISQTLLAWLAVLCAVSVCTEAQHTVEYHNQLERINAPATRTQLDPSIRLTVNSSVLEQSGQWFQVSWSGVQHPSLGDWVALLVPAGSDPAQTAPAKFKLASLSPTHLLFGRGSLRWVGCSCRGGDAHLTQPLARQDPAAPRAPQAAPKGGVACTLCCMLIGRQLCSVSCHHGGACCAGTRCHTLPPPTHPTADANMLTTHGPVRLSSSNCSSSKQEPSCP